MLAEALLQQVQEAAAAAASDDKQRPGAGAAGQSYGDSGAAAGAAVAGQLAVQAVQAKRPAVRCQLALLRLDHMHDRASYSRTIKRWARELGLGGRLLFCSGGSGSNGSGESGGVTAGTRASSASPPIILIVLEGEEAGVKEYLVRQRTRVVDVDSKGRPCRERMMTVVALQEPSCPDQPGTHGSSCGGDGNGAAAAAGSQSLGGPAPAHNCSSDSGGSGGGNGGGNTGSCGCGLLFGGEFEEQVVSVPQLAALLVRCGLEGHWRAATGLPGPPPALP